MDESWSFLQSFLKAGVTQRTQMRYIQGGGPGKGSRGRKRSAKEGKGLIGFVFCPTAAADHEALPQPVLDERLALLLIQEQGLATVTAQLMQLFRHLKKKL